MIRVSDEPFVGRLVQLRCHNVYFNAGRGCNKMFERLDVPTGMVEIKCPRCHKFNLFVFPTAEPEFVAVNWFDANNSPPISMTTAVLVSKEMALTA